MPSDGASEAGGASNGVDAVPEEGLAARPFGGTPLTPVIPIPAGLPLSFFDLRKSN